MLHLTLATVYAKSAILSCGNPQAKRLARFKVPAEFVFVDELPCYRGGKGAQARAARRRRDGRAVGATR
jgi:hypothetical protein